METFEKMAGTVGGAADAHLPERHKGKDGYGYNACLKFAREPTVECRAKGADRAGSGQKGPAYPPTH